MIEQIVGQFLQSGQGRGVLDQLKQQGVEGPQAEAAVSATAEGALQQVTSGGGGISGLLSSLAGGGATSGAANQVTQFVTQKTGLNPSVASTVVAAVLPRLLELFQSNTVPASRPSAAGLLGGIANMAFGNKR